MGKQHLRQYVLTGLLSFCHPLDGSVNLNDCATLKMLSENVAEPWHLSVYVGESVEAETIIDLMYTFSPLMLSMVPELATCLSCRSGIFYSASVTDDAIGVYKVCNCGHGDAKDAFDLKQALSKPELCRALRALSTISAAFEVVLVYIHCNLDSATAKLSIAVWVPSRELRLQRSGKYTDLDYCIGKLMDDIHGDLSRYCINGNTYLHFANIADECTCKRLFNCICRYPDMLLVMTSQPESVDMIRVRQLAHEGVTVHGSGGYP